jgi:hypothetical protein
MDEFKDVTIPEEENVTKILSQDQAKDGERETLANEQMIATPPDLSIPKKEMVEIQGWK